MIKTFGKEYEENCKSLMKRIAVIKEKIKDRCIMLYNLNEAIEAVVNTEVKTNTDIYDLLGNPEDLVIAEEAVTSAVEAVNKLDKNSADYQRLMERINAAKSKIQNALDRILLDD